METKEYRWTDRPQWPAGPWDNEPDKRQWQDEATGLPCLIVRHPRTGHLCGYVAVPESHPLFGKDYDAPNVDVHSGLTFADACHTSADESHGICHVDPSNDRVWWFGFDCAHFQDYSPQDVVNAQEREPRDIWRIDPHSSYRDFDYVRSECQSLARQLHELRA